MKQARRRAEGIPSPRDVITGGSSAGLFASALALGALACHSGDPSQLCGVRAQVELAASPLTLAAGSVLEPMGTSFFLHATDTDGRTVRWAELSPTGMLGAEHAATIPAHEPTLGPWVALAGAATPFDRVLVFYGAPSSKNPASFSLWVSSFVRTAEADAGAATSTPQEMLALPGPTAALRLSVGSGRAGMHAGVAFGLSGLESITFVAVDGGGKATGATQTVAGGTDALDFKCLSATSVPGGAADLTLAYVRQSSDTDPSPSWRFFDIDAAGGVGSSNAMVLNGMNPSCPAMALPSSGDVVLAWEDPRSAWFVTWSPAVSQLVPRQIDAASAQPGGVLRPVVGVGALSKGYGVLFQSLRGGALRVVDAYGNALQGDVALPARAAQVGTISALPVGTSLYVSYADYDSAAATGGRRQFLRVGCE